MIARITKPKTRIESFDLLPGRKIAGKYVIDCKLGSGWEGEVYKVVEARTGICRTAKLFYPHRNIRDKAVTYYAKQLNRLSKCVIVIHYIHSESILVKGVPITCLISEYVEGELLCDFVTRQPGKRLRPFEALHLTYALAQGLEDIHRVKEYHGDLHAANVLVRRHGILFDIKLVDFYHWGAPTAAHIKDDVVNLVRLLYDSIGGQKHYKTQPKEIKEICRGLRRDLITKSFPTARHLREHLESFTWSYRG